MEPGKAERDAEVDAAHSYLAEQAGEILKGRRERLRLTQIAAATSAGISPTTWGEIERGNAPGSRGITLIAIDDAVLWHRGTLQSLLTHGIGPDEADTLIDTVATPTAQARPAAFAGLELPDDLTPEDFAQIQGYVDGVIARRRRRRA